MRPTATAQATPADIRGKLRVSSDLGRHVGWIEGDFALGFDTVFLHNVGGDAERVLDVFASKVLPRFAATA